MSECRPEPRPRIIAPVLSVDQAQRAAMKQQRACCIWLTGLSGAGKSTLGNALDQTLQGHGLHSYVLDGDCVRNGLCQDLGMSDLDRKENIRRIGEVARLMVDAGLIVIVSAISPFRADRDTCRAHFAVGDFIEVHVSTPLSECMRRDAKGLYRAVLEGRIRNFTGIDSPYEAPLAPEFVIDTCTADSRELIDQLLMMQLEAGSVRGAYPPFTASRSPAR